MEKENDNFKMPNLEVGKKRLNGRVFLRVPTLNLKRSWRSEFQTVPSSGTNSMKF